MTFGAGSLFASDDSGTVFRIDPSSFTQEASNVISTVAIEKLEFGEDLVYVIDNNNVLYALNVSDLSQEGASINLSSSVSSVEFGVNTLYLGEDNGSIDLLTRSDLINAQNNSIDNVYSINNSGKTVRFFGNIDMAGNEVINSPSISSRHYKREISSINRESKALLNAHPIKFRYKNGTHDHGSEPHFGLIAEELSQVLPEAVAYNKSHAPYGIKYTEILPLLLDIIQEQRQQLEQHNEQLYAQQDQIHDLYRLIG